MTAPSPEIGRGIEARQLIRRAEHAALGTNQGGRPYVSLVAAAAAPDASPLLLLSDLAQHTRNLAADPSVSLLFAAREVAGDPLAAARLTLIGRAERCDDPGLAARFVARHPGSAAYAGFGDFHLYRVAIERGHLVAGFGRIAWVEGEHLRFTAKAEPLILAEGDIVAHMNTDHADAVALFASRLLGLPGTDWRMSGIDPEGIDLIRADATGQATARLDFAAPVLDPAAARTALVELARAARHRAAE
jgi:heme oxygenase (biliverdin-IX-beta and delta-forming)